MPFTNASARLVDGEWVPLCRRNLTEVGNTTAIDNFGGPFTFAIGMTGLLLDMLAVFVLANQRPRTSTSFILTALSLSDAFEILQLVLAGQSSALGIIYSHFLYRTKLNPFAEYATSILRWTTGFGHVAVLFNRGILIILATERWIAVCFPLRASSLCTRKRAMQAVASWGVIAFALNICRFFEWEGSVCFDLYHDTVRWDVHRLPLSLNKEYKWIMMTIWPIMVNACIPFVILLVMNIMIVRTLLRSNDVHENASSQHARQRQESARKNITVMSILICCLFMLLMIPYIVIRVYISICMTRIEKILRSGGKLGEDDFPKEWVLKTLPIWLILNNSLNFLIYCCMSTRFRNSFKRTFGLQNLCKRLRRPEAASDRTDRNTSRRSCVAYIHRHKESARILFDKTSEIALTHSVSTGVSTGSGGGSAPKYKSICIIEVGRA